MYLPPQAQYCIESLEQAGFAAYAVGGCVRDALLGLTPHDYDICTAAQPEQIARIFARHELVRSGEKHGTIGVVLEHQLYEITAFRTEGSYGDSRHPDWVRFVDQVELDLARRDFTVNAMAYSPTRGLCDPFGGAADLKNGILRAVGDPERRFSEDALRILRGVRFAARFDLRLEENTKNAMFRLASSMDKLARERVMDELCKLLPQVSAARLLEFAPILTQVIPPLQPCLGFRQHSPYHAYDVFTHTAYAVEAVPAELTLRWAALLHDVGKPTSFTLDDAGRGHFLGHAAQSADLAEEILLQLKAPTALRQRVCTLIRRHMSKIEPETKSVRRALSKLGSETFYQLIALQEADMRGKDIEKAIDTAYYDTLRAIAHRIEEENACLKVTDLAINGRDLIAMGYEGPAIGKALQGVLEQVLDEKVENSEEALLRALQQRGSREIL